MNVSCLQGCRCAFGPAETFNVVHFFLAHFLTVRVFVRNQLCSSLVGHVYLFLSPFLFLLPTCCCSFFFFPFRLFVASCVIFIYTHGFRRSFLFLSLFSLLSILGVVLLLLTKLTSSFTLLFPIFFLFIYFACLRISWVCLFARAKEKQVHTHKVTNSLTFCLLSTWRPFFPPVSIVPCSRSIALLLIDP